MPARGYIKTWTGLAVFALLIALLVFALSAVRMDDVRRYIAVVKVRGLLAFVRPEEEISWPISTPDEKGIDGEKLRQLSDNLVKQKTSALILLRHGFLLHEWYEPGREPEDRHSLAAATKGVVAGMLVLLAVEEGWIQLADPASAYIHEWEVNAQKAGITIYQLASHRSGIEDLWGGDYTRDRRFKIALNDARLLFEPGSHQSYTGTAFYVLARALANRLHHSSEPNIAKLYDDRLMRPLGISFNEYQISYGESYYEDGVDHYAIGSGGRFSPRATARVGHLVLNNGSWQAEQLLRPETVDLLFDNPFVARLPAWRKMMPISNLGWWLNTDGFFPSLPCDAVIAVGTGQQILLVVPSLDLVLVRNGSSFAQDGESAWSAMEARLFRPLMEALVMQPATGAGPDDVVGCRKIPGKL